MTTTQAALIEFIAKHYTRAVPLGSGKLLGEDVYAGDGFPDAAGEFYGPYWSQIPATLRDVKDWLGY
ncbi:hypothetical protein WK78_03110 [Burkholderia cepacia]|uniref:hypothetical protein n=1 Tax=Burkholderia cepacia TaxID=292 RepID=UPI00075E545C|nr:hypothetical protein [Burkholderia cepacia]KVV25097.1 hypothetical protein WK78_03110 [Burkholderia cepacia]